MTQAETQMATAAPPMKRLVIFDWGRTIWSVQEGRLYPDVMPTFRILRDKLGFKLAIRQRTFDAGIVKETIRDSKIESFVDGVFVFNRKTGRRDYFGLIAQSFKIHPECITAVDDQQLDLDYPKLRGAYTVWVAREGDRFADVSGNTTPDSTINCIQEILTVGPIEHLLRRSSDDG